MSKTWCDDGVCVIGADSSVIRVKNLSLKYGRTYALKNLSLELDPCQVTALIGPSGCGKTSLLNCLNRMTDHIEQCNVEGEILLGDNDVLSDKYDTLILRKKIGMIFQKANPFPMSIRKNITMPLKYHGVKNASEREFLLKSALEEVGLWDEVKDRLEESALRLSGGQQQRLCIARAVALEPEILLMDEPCSALDPISTKKVEELIRNLRKKMTIVLVTHNLAQARRVSDQTVVFWPENGIGNIIDRGKTEAIFLRPVNETISAYLNGAIG